MGCDSLASTKKMARRAFAKFKTDASNKNEIDNNIQDKLAIEALNESKLCYSFMAYVASISYKMSREAGLAASKRTFCRVIYF